MSRNLKWFASHLEEVLCAALLGVMALITFANVITRYLLKFSLAFTEELVVSLFVWVTLLGTAVAFRRGLHLGFSFLTERFALRLQRLLVWCSAALAAALFLFLIYFSIRQVGEEIALEITSSGIGVPQWWYTIGVPLWSVLIIARVFQGAQQAQRRRGPR